MTLPKPVADLVDRFHRNRDAYLSGQYNETQVRREFIDPMFESLGWDMNNCQGYAEAYKDVIHEDAIKIGGATKAPDYCFRVGGTRKFFLEAKKPSVRIHDDVSPAYQLRRYAWSAKLPLSVLTDFEELALYDCRVRPALNDSPATARVMYVQYTDYAAQWDDLAGVLSRDAVLKGSFDKYADSKRAKRGTAEVDAEFLKEIEAWRDALARNIAIRNSQLDQRGLNTAVQQTIDRIIFLRLCEDRGIEVYGRLQQHLNGDNVYARLMEVFRAADDRYNSGLFHFRPEKGRENYDRLTPGLAIDDKVLKDLIKRLYYPESPYEFSVLPADILGQVYEQFLGKVIRLTKGHQARVEEKPEVRKAGGVYYTPTYIVDYIVKNTVGKLLEGKTPKDIDGSMGSRSVGSRPVGSRTVGSRSRATAPPLRVLDPACGSGSFLINAFQFLLDWYRDQYANEPDKYTRTRSPRLYQRGHNDYALTAQERKRILLDHIYGVDIDPQAVEVTKLSLLLKVLEGENDQSIQNQLNLFHQRALPDLDQNIKCGNSLIAPDFYNNQQADLFNEEEMYRINAFDWNSEFPFLKKDGGFDAVIGNPPYIPIELMTTPDKTYYCSRNPELERKYDSAAVFVLEMLKRLGARGRLGFISSVTWQTGQNYRSFRQLLFTRAGVHSIVNLPFDVFPSAYVDTGVYILLKTQTSTYDIYRFAKKDRAPDLMAIKYVRINTSLVTPPDYRVVLDPIARSISLRCENNPIFLQLGQITASTQGLAANRFTRNSKPDGDGWYPFLEKGQIYRYQFECSEVSFADMRPHVSLVRFYEAQPKLLIRRVVSRADRLMATVTDQQMVFKKDVNPFILSDPRWDLVALLAIVNSALISYLYLNSSSIATKDDFRQTTLAELRAIPVPDLTKMRDHSRQLTGLAGQILDLHKRLQTTKTDHDRTILQRQITATDQQIDDLVYDLYGLTNEEIRIVESAAS